MLINFFSIHDYLFTVSLLCSYFIKCWVEVIKSLSFWVNPQTACSDAGRLKKLRGASSLNILKRGKGCVIVIVSCCGKQNYSFLFCELFRAPPVKINVFFWCGDDGIKLRLKELFMSDFKILMNIMKSYLQGYCTI